MTANDTRTNRASDANADGARRTTRRERRVFAALNASQQSLWQWDPASGQVTIEGGFWHQIAQEQQAGPFPAEAFFKLMDARDRDRVHAALLTMAAADTRSSRPLNLDFRVPVDNGSADFTLSVGMSGIEEDGPPVAAGLLRGAGEMKNLQRRLLDSADDARRASESKSNFVAMISHEIRTPLNGVIGMTELLLDSGLTDQQKRYAQTVRKSGHLLLHIVNGILDFSKIEAGQLELDEVSVNVRELVEGAVQLCAPKTQGKNLAVLYEPDELPYERYRCDPTRLRQILINLIGNAIKFTERGAVRIRCAPVDDGSGGTMLRFSVTDTGIGIPQDRISTLFDEFIQADMSISRRYGGTGLGLAISRRLAEAMGGELQVESELNKGSTFWFTARLAPAQNGDRTEDELNPFSINGLPPAAEADEIEDIEPASPTPAAPPASQKAKILVAEDNKVNQAVITALLLRAGYQMDLVADGRAALEAAKTGAYSLVLMDLHMPEMDGLEATRRIRELGGSLGTVPIVALSAEMMEGDRPMLEAAQLDDHVTKPIDREKLFGVIEHWLDRQSTGEARQARA